jgi:hypothetical protein
MKLIYVGELVRFLQKLEKRGQPEMVEHTSESKGPQLLSLATIKPRSAESFHR